MTNYACLSVDSRSFKHHEPLAMRLLDMCVWLIRWYLTSSSFCLLCTPNDLSQYWVYCERCITNIKLRRGTVLDADISYIPSIASAMLAVICGTWISSFVVYVVSSYLMSICTVILITCSTSVLRRMLLKLSTPYHYKYDMLFSTHTIILYSELHSPFYTRNINL